MTVVPRHVAIIMDGNGRWAKQRGLPRIAGHKAGEKSARKIVKACDEMGISVLTLFAFSCENWSRPNEEVSSLMSLFSQFLRKDAKRLHKNGVKLRIIGERSQLNQKLQNAILDVHELTSANNGLQLNIAINYSGRWDIVNAAKKIAKEVANGNLLPGQIDEEKFNSMMSLADLPEPDLFIRTSGEERISNFMLWQFAYTELFFTEALWPDFDKKELERAVEAYAKRERRFGGI